MSKKIKVDSNVNEEFEGNMFSQGQTTLDLNFSDVFDKVTSPSDVAEEVVNKVETMINEASEDDNPNHIVESICDGMALLSRTGNANNKAIKKAIDKLAKFLTALSEKDPDLTFRRSYKNTDGDSVASVGMVEVVTLEHSFPTNEDFYKSLEDNGYKGDELIKKKEQVMFTLDKEALKKHPKLQELLDKGLVTKTASKVIEIV